MVMQDRKREFPNDSEERSKGGSRATGQEATRLHKVRSGFKETSSRRSESLVIVKKMENNTSGFECSELLMNT